MDRDITQAIYVGAFLHDIGKLAERANAVPAGDPDIIRQEYGYPHAFYTEWVLKRLFGYESVSRCISPGLPALNVVNLAARHHQPRNIFECIVAEANRLSSGADKSMPVNQRKEKEQKSTVPLRAILKRVRLNHRDREEDRDVTGYCYRMGIMPWSVHHVGKNVYPVTRQAYEEASIQRDYKAQWEHFSHELTADHGSGVIDPYQHFVTLVEVCRKYLWCVPASTQREVLQDVSLFDHMKCTSALATCLYQYHSANASLNKTAICDRSAQKFILVHLHLTGIRRFVYNISAQGGYADLKGRSFFVTLASEIIAKHFTERLRILPVNILYASGGTFYVIAPNTEHITEKLYELQDRVNLVLFEKFKGDLYVQMGWRALSGNNLLGHPSRSWNTIWAEAASAAKTMDKRPYARIATNNYNFLFRVNNTAVDTATCPVCNKEIAIQTDSLCRTCAQMREVAESIGQALCIIIGNDETSMKQQKPLFEFLGKYVWIEPQLPYAVQDASILLADNHELIPALLKCQNGNTVNVVPRMFAGRHIIDKHFAESAALSTGRHRLGLLVMDMDNTVEILSSHQVYSIGHLSTLSHQLKFLFETLVPHVLEESETWKQKASIVYSGSDDLFILGAWSVLPEIARRLRDVFAHFTCYNPALTLSGGMVVTPANFPMYRSAHMVAEQLGKAKGHTTKCPAGTMVSKGAITFLGSAMHWREYEHLMALKERILDSIPSSPKRAFIRILAQIPTSYEKSINPFMDRRQAMPLEIVGERLQAERWRWQMVDALSKFCKNLPETKIIVNDIQSFLIDRVGGTCRSGIALLQPLASWLKMLTDKKGGVIG
jgi:CRISPR-associated protein Csm1